MQKRIQSADPERLVSYINMLDKFLLYTLVANSFPQEIISDIVSKWELAVKKTIDQEANSRTQFMENTLGGRLAKKQNEPDGEAIRLNFLDILLTAKMIVSKNLSLNQDSNEDDDNTNIAN